MRDILKEIEQFGREKNVCVLLEFHPDMKTIPKFDCHLVDVKRTFKPAVSGHGDSYQEAWDEALRVYGEIK